MRHLRSFGPSGTGEMDKGSRVTSIPTEVNRLFPAVASRAMHRLLNLIEFRSFSDVCPAHAHPLSYRALELHRPVSILHRTARCRLSQRQRTDRERDRTRKHHACRFRCRLRHCMGGQCQSTRSADRPTGGRISNGRRRRGEAPSPCVQFSRTWVVARREFTSGVDVWEYEVRRTNGWRGSQCMCQRWVRLGEREQLRYAVVELSSRWRFVLFNVHFRCFGWHGWQGGCGGFIGGESGRGVEWAFYAALLNVAFHIGRFGPPLAFF